MVIVFVIDNYLHQSNGTTITTRRFVEQLRMRGHEVRILSVGQGEEGYYSLKERYIPIVSDVARKQDVIFSKPDKKVIHEALKGADVVHFVTPWKTSQVARNIAQKLNIPQTASFHIQPENITYGAGLNNVPFLNSYIYRRFRKFYGKIPFVHAPSNFIASELRNHNYPTTVKVISNGVGDAFFKGEVKEPKGKYHIISTGRYAKEKNQILITLAGHGPKRDFLENYAKKHNLDVEFKFFKQEELIKALESAHLYVHAANIEIEAIACLEAIAVGLIPVIANARKSATKQFALTSNNLFKPNDVDDLREKIEYWLLNDEERLNAKLKYKSYTERFRLGYSVDRFEEMLQDAIKLQKAKKISETVKGKAFKKALTHPPVKRTLSAMTYYLFALPLLFLYMKFILNVKYIGRKNFREIKGGAVVISNHVHVLDSAMNSLAAFPKRPIMTAMKANFEKPIAGFFVNLLGAVPVPGNMLETQLFFQTLGNEARRGRYVHIYPEGELIDKDKEIREFKRGAFHLAVESGVP